MSTSKWRRRSETDSSGLTPGVVTRNKRADHPSPAYGSPAADMIRVAATGKRVRDFLLCQPLQTLTHLSRTQ